MVWALQLTAIWAFVRVRTVKRVVGPTVVPAGFGDFILWDSHVSTSGRGPHQLAVDRVNIVACSALPDRRFVGL